MTEWGRGAKAGLVSGLIYGILSGVIWAAGFAVFVPLEEIREVYFPAKLFMEFGPEFSLETLRMIGVVSMFIAGIILGIVFGTIFGVIFAPTYMILPGKASLTKGIIFWVVFCILLPLAGVVLFGYICWITAINFIPMIIYGALLGLFWDRFAPK